MKPEFRKISKITNNDTERKDLRTDFGRGIVFRDINGGEHGNMEDVRQANKFYWDSIMEQQHMKRIIFAALYEIKHIKQNLKKAYFDSITPKFNINDKDMVEQIFKAQQERFIAYVKEKYGSYLSELLEQYGYGQDVNDGPRK